MIKLTDLEVRNVYEQIQRVSGKSVEFKLGYRLSKIANQLEGSYKTTEKMRLDLIKKYATDEAKLLTVPQEKIEDFIKEFNDLLEKESNDFPNIQKIPMSLMEMAGGSFDTAFYKHMENLIDENA